MLSSYEGKTVLITGHTGFKGAWLAQWLNLLGADVVGFSLEPAGGPNLFRDSGVSRILTDLRGDIRSLSAMKRLVHSVEPDFVFHLAAQSLVRKSYENPVLTWQTNLFGTINLLQALRGLRKKCSAVMVTSDKVYENSEWVWGYRETDKVGGTDPYSASKGATEIALKSFVESFFPRDGQTKIAIARAGNVIGGGDWAQDRVVPDVIRSWSSNEPGLLRSPQSTRPWQHVLEPLSAYLWLAQTLGADQRLHGEAFNFGPVSSHSRSVQDLVSAMASSWPGASWRHVSSESETVSEAGLLKLNCDKALEVLGWFGALTFEDTVSMTVRWYRDFAEKPDNARGVTTAQIATYVEIAKERGLAWARE